MNMESESAKPLHNERKVNWDQLRAQYAARLDGMEPFQCKVLSWPHAREWFEPKNRRLAEAFAGISGCVSVSGNWFQPDRWALACDITAAVPGTVLAVHFSPYHTGGWEDGFDPCRESWRHNATLSTFCHRLKRIKRVAEPKNVPIGFVVFDHEKMTTTYGADARHDNCVAEKLTAFDRTARDLCPGAEIIWYGAPTRTRGQGWIGPRVDFHAPSLYRLWWTENIYAEYYRSRGKGEWKWPAEPMPGMVPFVALGAGYRRVDDGSWSWDMNYEYPLSQSKLCGSFLRKAPALAQACFYPEVPEPETGRVREWWDHFWAFKRGWDDAANDR